jgi:hypothetical protein
MDYLLQRSAQTQLSSALPCPPYPWQEKGIHRLQFSKTRTAQEIQCLLGVNRLYPVSWKCRVTANKGARKQLARGLRVHAPCEGQIGCRS